MDATIDADEVLQVAPTERALVCAQSFLAGIPLDATATGTAVEGRCGCGYYFAARTIRAARAAFFAHLEHRTAQ